MHMALQSYITADTLPRLPWWGEDESPQVMCAAIAAAAQEATKNREMMHMFEKRSLLGFVFLANKHERTLPAGCDQHTTNRLLEQLVVDFTSDMQEPQHSESWPAEGGGDARTQLVQFCQAAMYLCWPVKPLTVDSIKKAHRIMMWGAADDGKSVGPGEFRTTAAHSGTGYIYPEASTLPQGLEQIVERFNVSLNAGTPGYQLVADLLYSFVVLHPFSNGNGRMCRRLAAYAARAGGFPFMLQLCNGHRRTRQHYMQALRWADKRQGSTLRLQSYILECMHFQWQNALAYSRAGNQAEEG